MKHEEALTVSLSRWRIGDVTAVLLRELVEVLFFSQTWEFCLVGIKSRHQVLSYLNQQMAFDLSDEPLLSISVDLEHSYFVEAVAAKLDQQY